MNYRLIITTVGVGCILYGLIKLALLATLLSPELRQQYFFLIGDGSETFGAASVMVSVITSALSVCITMAAGVGLLKARHWARCLLLAWGLLVLMITAASAGPGWFSVFKLLGLLALAGLLFNPLANKWFSR